MADLFWSVRSCGSGIFEVEAIMDERVIRGRKQYLICWKGFGPEDNTWEEEQDCDGCPLIVAAW